MGRVMKVLVVDPMPQRQADTVRMLESADYEVDAVATGEDCLRLAREMHPDLMLLNMALSDISGIDLVRRIKHDPELADAYVVLLSEGDTPSPILARGMENGAEECLVHGLPKREFLARIGAMLRHKAIEDDLRHAQQQWETVFQAIDDPLFVTDLEHRITHCNLAMAKFLGEAPSRVEGRYCYELVHGTAEPIARCLLNRVLETQSRETLVVETGDYWLRFTVDPLLDAEDNVIGGVHTLVDVTEQHRLEEELSQAQAALEEQAEEHRAALERQAEEHRAELAELEEKVQAELARRQQVEEELTRVRAALAGTEKELQAEVAQRQQVEQELAQMQAALQKQAEEHRAELAELEEKLQVELAQQQQVEEELQRVRATLADTEEKLQAELAQRQQVEQELAQMQAELQKQAEEHRAALAAAEEKLQVELAQRQQVEQELAQTRIALEKQAEKQRQALAAVAEALRTGLSAISPDETP